MADDIDQDALARHIADQILQHARSLHAQEIVYRSYERARAAPCERYQHLAAVLSFVERANRFGSMDEDLWEAAELERRYTAGGTGYRGDADAQWDAAHRAAAEWKVAHYAQAGDSTIPPYMLAAGALYYRRVAGADVQIVVWPISYGCAQVVVGPIGAGFHDDVFWYPSPRQAVEAARRWDGIGDAPLGWIRNPTTGRRREDGDPMKEVVRW